MIYIDSKYLAFLHPHRYLAFYSIFLLNVSFFCFLRRTISYDFSENRLIVFLGERFFDKSCTIVIVGGGKQSLKNPFSKKN